MMVRNPEDMHPVFVDAFSREDLDALMDLYEPDAILIPQPGQAPVSGHAAIREVLKAFLALHARLTMRTDSVIKTAEVALLRSTWTLAVSGPDGKATEMTHRALEVVRHQRDGGWRFVIDHPFGGGLDRL
jgi:uncharacterized protein (TIGR02246 family)